MPFSENDLYRILTALRPQVAEKTVIDRSPEGDYLFINGGQYHINISSIGSPKNRGYLATRTYIYCQDKARSISVVKFFDTQQDFIEYIDLFVVPYISDQREMSLREFNKIIEGRK